MKRLASWVRRKLHRLVQLHDTPHSIAGGTAVGVFVGFTPLLGVKTLLGIGLAWGLRCSPVAAAIGVALHDLLLPILPVLLRFEYAVGYWLLASPHRWPEQIQVAHLRHLDHWLHWSTLSGVVWPTLIGSVVIGGPLSAVAFWVTLRVVRKIQARRFHHHLEALEARENERRTELH